MVLAEGLRALVLNAGSSTLKWAVLEADGGAVVASGTETWADGRDAVIRDGLRAAPAFAAVGHRVVHGGAQFRAAVRVDAAVRARLEALVELDPLHMAPSLAGIDAAAAAFPDVPQVAAFDTAFHAAMPAAAAGYALPYEWSQRWGLRRYGFHGLSVAYSVARVAALAGRMPARLVVCHLGGGCSVTAVEDGRSVDTTMGMTPLEGLPMATRSGSVDPGLLLHLVLRRGVAPAELLSALEERSGLLGVSGISGDLREVLAAADAGDARARLAYDGFIVGLRRAVGAMAGVLGGCDAVAFTGGIGENSGRVRAAAAAALPGLRLDDARNRAPPGDADVAAGESPVRAFVVRAREDLVILGEMARVLGWPPVTG